MRASIWTHPLTLQVYIPYLGWQFTEILLAIQRYKVKILEDINIENDPNYLCTNYEKPGVYDQCLEREITKESVREVLL